MSLRSRFERITQEKPRLLMLIDRDNAGEPPIGRRTVSDEEVDRRFAPLLGHVANGTIAVDDATAPLVARELTRIWKGVMPDE